MFGPRSERESERDMYSKDSVVCDDDSVHLLRTHTLPRPSFPQHRPPPAAPATQPAVPSTLHYIVSDSLDGTRRQLTRYEYENLDAAAMGSLRLEDVVPNRTYVGAKFANAPSRTHRRSDSRYVTPRPFGDRC